MRWLGIVLLGPTLWAVIFVLIYGLHGVLCASVAGPEGSGVAARIVLVGVWAVGIAGFAPILRAVPKGHSLAETLPRAGLWIGFVATVFTLFPVAVTTSC